MIIIVSNNLQYPEFIGSITVKTMTEPLHKFKTGSLLKYHGQNNNLFYFLKLTKNNGVDTSC